MEPSLSRPAAAGDRRCVPCCRSRSQQQPARRGRGRSLSAWRSSHNHRAATKRELFMCRVERGNLVRARLIRHALRLHHLALSTFVHNFGDFLKRHHLWCAVISTGSIALLEWQVSQSFSHTPLRRTNFTKLPVDLLAALLISSILPKRQTSALSRRSPRKLIHCHHASNLSRACAAQPTVQLQSHHEMLTRIWLSPAREHPMTSTVLRRSKATRSRISPQCIPTACDAAPRAVSRQTDPPRFSPSDLH